jgi:hypothetical protein
VITESDLGGRSRGTLSNAGSTEATPAASPSPAAAGDAKAGEAKEKTPDEVRAEQEAAWRQRLDQARTEVTSLTDKVNRIQLTLNDMTANLYSSSRTAALDHLEATKKELAAAQQKVADLEEEGRRNRYR